MLFQKLHNPVTVHCKQVLKKQAKKTSKIIKINEKYPSEIMMFFRHLF